VATLKLMDVMRTRLRCQHRSRRTEQAYCDWVDRFLRFHSFRHPREMGQVEVQAFLNHLAVDRHVTAATQNQALSAILYLYKQVLEIDLPWLQGLIRAHKPVRLPTVLSRPEVRSLLSILEHPTDLVARLLYGSGLRLLEAMTLRIKDLDFDRPALTVRQAKGDRDRQTLLPPPLHEPLRRHLEAVRHQFEHDKQQGAGFVELPTHSPPSCAAPIANGPGNGSSRQPEPTCTDRPAKFAATTYTRRWCSATSSKPFAWRA
jgi:integrase